VDVRIVEGDAKTQLIEPSPCGPVRRSAAFASIGVPSAGPYRGRLDKGCRRRDESSPLTA
jgi:hypothetical protein